MLQQTDWHCATVDTRTAPPSHVPPRSVCGYAAKADGRQKAVFVPVAVADGVAPAVRLAVAVRAAVSDADEDGGTVAVAVPVADGSGPSHSMTTSPLPTRQLNPEPGAPPCPTETSLP